MEQYIKLFSNHTTYETAKNNIDKPNVAMCYQEGELHYNPLPVIIATDDTNLPLMNIARTYGWIEQDATKFYESEANNVTSINEGVVCTFVNTHTQETIDTEYGSFTLDLWYDKDENKWYDTTELMGGSRFTLTNISFKAIHPIKSQDDETASLYEEIDWTNIEHFDEFRYFTSVTSIDNYTFLDCVSLTSIIIPNNVTSIGNYAFSGCTNLTSCTIGNSVTSIGEAAFYGCSSLPIINNIRYADTYVVEAIDKTLTEYTIKSDAKWIGENAFSGCSNLTNITIPSGVISIGNSAFYNCSSLTNIIIPNNVTNIGSSAFYRCTSLTSIIIPNSVIIILWNAFYGCSGLTSVTIGNGVTTIGMWAFQYCSSLTSITIPNSVTNIGEEVFEFCSSLASIIVESGNTKYDSRNNCNAIIETSTNTLIVGCKNTIIPNSVTTIGNRAFYYCSGLTSLTIPNSVTSIGEEAFYSCSRLISTTIGNSVTSIGKSAFSNCSGMTSITIGESVTDIGEYAFFSCSSLTSIVCNAITAPAIRYNTFQDIKTGGVLTVPVGSTDYSWTTITSNYYLGLYNWTKVEQ